MALFTRKKQETSDKKLTTWDKTTIFIRENIGKITTLMFIPTITEELMATAKGNKLAKSFLPKELFKRTAKVNALGASTYIITAAGTGLAAMMGIKVKDKVQAKYDAKHS